MFEEIAQAEATQPSTNGSQAIRLSFVDGQTLEGLQDRLLSAEELLFEVVAERPAMTDPWVYLLMSGRGRGLKLPELRSRFDNAHSRSEFRADACHEYMQGLTAKWGGTQKVVFEFARWVENESPEDSPARECLPIAHIEQGLVHDGGNGFGSYLRQAHVSDELLAVS